MKIIHTSSFDPISAVNLDQAIIQHKTSCGDSSISLMERQEQNAEKNSSFCCSFFSRIFTSIVNCLKFLFCFSSSKEKTKAKKPQVDKYGEVPLKRRTREEKERVRAERERRLGN